MVYATIFGYDSKTKDFIGYTHYLSGDSSKHEVYYNHVYQKGLIIQIHL